MNENNVHLLSSFSGFELMIIFSIAKSTLSQIADGVKEENPEEAWDGWQIIGKLSAHDYVINPDSMYVLAEIEELIEKVEKEENNG